MPDRRLLAIALVAVLAVASASIAILALQPEGSPTPVLIRQKGSDTMFEMCLEWADEYHSLKKHVTVNVSGGGSGTGITAFINKEVDVAQASRPMKQSERGLALAAGIEVLEIPVAIDGITMICHRTGSVQDLTVEQLRGIYNGSIGNWAQVGGPDLAITLYGRLNTSGTYIFFQEHVLQSRPYAPAMIQLVGNSAILNAVTNDPSAIGYVGLGYVDEGSTVKVVELRKDASSPAYSPLDEEAVVSGDYALSRYLYFYIDGKPQGDLRDYVLWAISEDGGQPIAVEVGFYALPESMVQDNIQRIG